MTKIATSIFAIIAAACSSPTPATSSSSHWATCTTMDDCTSVTTAVACTGGYCVDSNGQKIESGTSSTGSCDPLAPQELPVALGTVLGVGKDAQGTTYMVDSEPQTGYRVFVSDGTTLFRKKIAGSSSSGGGPDNDYSFTFEDGTTTQALLFQIRGGAVTGMALGPGDVRGFIGDPGATTEMLTLDSESVVSAFTLRNLPGDVAIEYVADVTDGTALVVTRPAVDWEYTDFRVFYGTDGPSLSERQVLNVLRAKDGGSTEIQFIVDGATYTARFPWVLEPGDGGISGHPGQGTLDKNGVPVAMSQRYPTPTTLSGFTFSCL